MRHLQTVIVDEIHALAAISARTPALSLERLQALAADLTRSACRHAESDRGSGTLPDRAVDAN